MADGWNKLTQALLGTSPQGDVKTRLDSINEKIKNKETLAPDEIKFLQTQGGLNVTPQEKVAVGDSSYTKYNVAPLYVQKDGADYRDARGKRTLNPIYDTSPLADVGAGVALAGQAAQKESNPYTKLGMLIGGAVGGLINPNLAGKQKYLRDKAEAEKKTLQSMTLTEAELKLQAANANIQRTKAIVTKTGILTALAQENLEKKENDAIYESITQLVDIYTDSKTHAETPLADKAFFELKRRLIPVLSKVGITGEDIGSYSENAILGLAMNYTFDKKATMRTLDDGRLLAQNRNNNYVFLEKNGDFIIDLSLIHI